MERLTEEKQIGPWASLKDKAEAIPGAFANYDCLMAHMTAVTRLKAYEDTGLMPDEIRAMQEEHFSGLEMAKLHSALMELKKYQEADKDGRLVVLPCKVGDTVWAIENPWTGELLKKPIEAYVNGMKKFSHGLYVNVLFDTRKINGTKDYEVNHIGKTLFLTCEEAERALEAKRDG